MASQKKIYQFRVILRYSWPQIWRRIQVPSTDTFQQFHWILVRAMGWYGSHHHSFTVVNPKTKEEEDIVVDDSFMDEEVPKRRKESIARLKDNFLKEGDSVYYIYDMGDSWEHDIILEKILPAQQGISYPICIAGERACPPEDSGGIDGFEQFLESIADPENEEHDHMLNWVGGYYDPDDFDHRHIPVLNHLLKSQAIQMKIVVKGSDPEIWRRIQISEIFVFQTLHTTIQRLMGWSGNEPYFFTTHEGETIGEQHNIEGRPQPSKPASTIVSRYVSWNWKGGYHPLKYKYGSDDDAWEFEIINERLCHERAHVQYPILLGGELASPPENCGGVKGFKRFLKTLTNRRSKANVNAEYITFSPKEFEPMDIQLSGKEKRVCQLKVSLKNTEPLIWRRIIIPELCTFDELHKVINRAMGWQGCAAYAFIIIDTTKKNHTKHVIGTDSDENGEYLVTKSSKKETINSLVKSVKSKFSYIYNFDESWDHEVELEAILPQKLTKTYPRLINGERACPPEQCRGIAEFEKILRAVTNSKHPDHKSTLKKLGGKYNPKFFDPSSIVLAPEQTRIFQFRIVILGIVKPRIWRRVQVSDNISFKEFHQVVSRAMGWKNDHKHLFVVRNPVTTLIERLGDEIPKTMEPKTTRSEEMKLKELFLNEEVRGVYKYDYKHNWTWTHDVILEDIKACEAGVEYPRCLAGQGACPPEMEKGLTTMFGPYAYRILLNPEDKDYKTMLDIFGESYIDHNFDPASVTFTKVE